MATSTSTLKAYVLKQIKGYDSTIAQASYVAKESGKSLISATDLAQIGTNKTAIETVANSLGTIAVGQTVSGLLDEKVDKVAGYALVSTSDIAQIGTNTTAIATINGDENTVGSIKNLVKASTYDDTALAGRVTTVEGDITTLKGADTVDGSVAKAVKDGINAFATEVSNDQTVNTFKELVDYAASHTSEYSTLAGEVQANTSAVATINGDESTTGSFKKAVKDLADGAVATNTSAIATLNGDASTAGSVAKAVADATSGAVKVADFDDIDFVTEW